MTTRHKMPCSSVCVNSRGVCRFSHHPIARHVYPSTRGRRNSGAAQEFLGIMLHEGNLFISDRPLVNFMFDRTSVP
jgi:hypothetical protein